MEERTCAHCQQWIGGSPRKGLCRPCYDYHYKYGRPRPSYLFDGQPRRCARCGWAVKPGGQSRFLCGACYRRDYRQRQAIKRLRDDDELRAIAPARRGRRRPGGDDGP